MSYSFDALRDTGLLWYINRVALHPHGLALALEYDDIEGEPEGWSIMVAPDGLWTFTDEDDEAGRERFTEFIKEYVKGVNEV